ncbi:zinc-dependent alcohol dehydrogenase family protein [Actinobacillus suis]|uniref:Alcohol dehydrogenase n=2 Tax=Actinobacillus suis TaxID=716 RepID=K0FX86_ACTSU|nr:zinc-dependent alcohol dehydrogenase family protein [Actinobacillus suis]AFU19052.1 alcohol dehydrogenase [Actinobacillus suis H91-0380]AIJ31130.1 alcohol dehydrogenase [Actinobacillus suis ATCC 33415]MCO4166762.1 zinc-dependent alcohol dehydrogenase family protein [Actinobacillus suis]MCO4168560.1 zinc-dependent alcohol dehydrogenase family protein [Actinobacillus suis]MCQ9628735.1 zinc-dependent alcohol dehydrogenase family protein [Actinobacillus suis]
MTKQIQFNQTGSADVLQIVDVQVAAPKSHEVQIQMQALGLNRAEMMYREGAYVIEPVFPATMGYEGAGVVTAVGADVSEFSVGDKVSVIPSFMFTEYGTYGELVNMPVHAVVKHPENLTMEQAAASWMMFVTAYGGLIEFGNLQKGDFVVLGGATSSVGLAAIQIAKMQGATVIALSRTHTKGDVLLEKGADFVIATKEDDVTAKLLEITNGKGVNLVFDPVGGKEAAKIINAMAQDGKYIIYGALSHDDISVPVFPILGKHLTVRGYELFEITTVPEKLAQAKKFVFDGLASGQLKPEIDKVFAFDDIAEAHRYMESNAQIGKILVKL